MTYTKEDYDALLASLDKFYARIAELKDLKDATGNRAAYALDYIDILSPGSVVTVECYGGSWSNECDSHSFNPRILYDTETWEKEQKKIRAEILKKDREKGAKIKASEREKDLQEYERLQKKLGLG